MRSSPPSQSLCRASEELGASVLPHCNDARRALQWLQQLLDRRDEPPNRILTAPSTIDHRNSTNLHPLVTSRVMPIALSVHCSVENIEGIECF